MYMLCNDVYSTAILQSLDLRQRR